ncbi:unnamed protein product [Blepharisma stoltei]|uniref:EF-hand domain-containing protein n=1 Tax=Blepharisma stoltei TaxID=1481888 RepID=A0AAU9JPW9_9CILI|nr:unnamed protein product [Blepharisma stoltei]
MSSSSKKTRGSIYHRLYKNTKQALSRSLSSSESGSFKKTTSTNSTPKLKTDFYAKGLKFKQETMKIIEIERKKIEDERKKNETFRPTIDKASKQMLRRPNLKAEDLLIEAGKTYKSHISELKEAKQNAELSECSFKPTISGSRTSRSRSSSRDVYSDLYNDAGERRSRNSSLSEQSTSQCSFRPRIQSHIRNSSESKEAIFERLYNSKKKFYEDMKARKKQLESLEASVDQTNGQELFHPTINNGSRTSRSRNGSIWDYLYSLKDNQTAKQQENLEKTQKFWEASSTAKKVCEESQKIFRNFQRKQLEQLFKSLDYDSDGLISSNSIKIEHLDVKSIVILTPYLNFLEESKEENDFDRFMEHMGELMQSLNVEDKAHLLKKEAKPVVEEKIVLINPRSAKLAEKRRSSMPQDVYERLMWTAQLKELKASKLKLMREQAELEGCTFQPSSGRKRKK